MFPMQPIKDGRFVENRIVTALLEQGPLDMNRIARKDFTREERVQFAQLIGYSLSGFSDLSYVSDIEWATACRIEEHNLCEEDASHEVLIETIKEAKEGVRMAATALFQIDDDDLVD